MASANCWISINTSSISFYLMFLWFSESINVVLAIAEWARGAPHSIKQSFAVAATNLISHCYRPTTATNLNEKKREETPHPACKPQHHIPPFQVNSLTINGHLLWVLLECICEYKSISEVNVNNCNRQGVGGEGMPPLLCNFKKSSKEVAEKPPKEKHFQFLQHKPGKDTFTID